MLHFAVFKHLNVENLFGIVVKDTNEQVGVKSEVDLSADLLQEKYYQAISDGKVPVNGKLAEETFIYDHSRFQFLTSEEEIKLGLVEKKH